MIKIRLKDPLIAVQAGEWCDTTLGAHNWELWGHDLLSGQAQYEFGFKDQQYATMFSLRWAEHS